MKSKILVAIQFTAIFILCLNSIINFNFSYIAISLILLGISIGILAISQNKLDNFNIRPDIKENCVLISSGIYKYIRHPMYSSVLISMFGVLLLNISNISLIIYFLLLINLILKMFYEESLWNNKSKEYKIYQESTKRIIPYIF